jgi:hypothetical protein
VFLVHIFYNTSVVVNSQNVTSSSSTAKKKRGYAGLNSRMQWDSQDEPDGVASKRPRGENNKESQRTGAKDAPADSSPTTNGVDSPCGSVTNFPVRSKVSGSPSGKDRKIPSPRSVSPPAAKVWRVVGEESDRFSRGQVSSSSSSASTLIQLAEIAVGAGNSANPRTSAQTKVPAPLTVERSPSPPARTPLTLALPPAVASSVSYADPATLQPPPLLLPPGELRLPASLAQGHFLQYAHMHPSPAGAVPVFAAPLGPVSFPLWMTYPHFPGAGDMSRRQAPVLPGRHPSAQGTTHAAAGIDRALVSAKPAEATRTAPCPIRVQDSSRGAHSRAMPPPALTSYWAGVLYLDATTHRQVWKGSFVQGASKPAPAEFAQSRNLFEYTSAAPAGSTAGDDAAAHEVVNLPVSGSMVGGYSQVSAAGTLSRHIDRDFMVTFHPVGEDRTPRLFAAVGCGVGEQGPFSMTGSYSPLSGVLELHRTH